MTYPRSHRCQVTEMEVGLSQSSSKVPALLSHTQICPCVDAKGQKTCK